MNNLYGISGHIGVGKDLVADIIQYLDYCQRTEIQPTYEDFDSLLWKLDLNNEWKNRKFADKLKEIVAILIGCTRRQLEDREFKEKELKKEWWYYKLPFNNASLITLNEYEKLSESQKNWYTLVKLTPRLLMQLIGTECVRTIIHPNAWVNALFADYNSDKKWVITDTRFPNEANRIKELGGVMVRIERPENCGMVVSNHESETALDNYDFDIVITNDGTIEDLINQINEKLFKYANY